MKREEHDLLLRALDAELTPAEQARLDRLLAHSAQARAAWERHLAVRAAVAATAAPSFGPYFSDRVMQRLHRERTAERAGAARDGAAPWWMPFRMAGAALAVAVLVAAVGLGLWLRPQTYTVPHGEVATYALPDGSTVELGSGSSLAYRRPFGWGTREVRLEGEAFFSVAHSKTPFVVVTFNARVEVKGTRFNVRAWPAAASGQTSVALASGRVEVAALAAPERTVVLTPGEATVVAADSTAPRLPVPVALSRVLSWRSGGLAFSDEPLEDVLQTLERRFAVRIRLADGALSDRRITYLDPQPPGVDSVLSTICVVKNLRYRRTADGFEVLGR